MKKKCCVELWPSSCITIFTLEYSKYFFFLPWHSNTDHWRRWEMRKCTPTTKKKKKKRNSQVGLKKSKTCVCTDYWNNTSFDKSSSGFFVFVFFYSSYLDIFFQNFPLQTCQGNGSSVVVANVLFSMFSVVVFLM